MKRRTILDIEYALSSNNIVPASVGCPNEAWLFIFAGSTFTVFHRGWTEKLARIFTFMLSFSFALKHR